MPPLPRAPTLAQILAVSEVYIAAIRAALEAADVEFIAENGGGAGVRMRRR